MTMDISDDYEGRASSDRRVQKRNEGILYLLPVLRPPRRSVPPSLVVYLLRGSTVPGVPAACLLYKNASEGMQHLDVAEMYHAAKTLRPTAAWVVDGHPTSDKRGQYRRIQ